MTSGEERKTPPALYQRVVVLAVMFAAAGVLGLPLLVRSPEFTKREKWFWGIAVTLYSGAMIALLVLAVVWGFRQMTKALTIY